jgi:hypothetical protein
MGSFGPGEPFCGARPALRSLAAWSVDIAAALIQDQEGSNHPSRAGNLATGTPRLDSPPCCFRTSNRNDNDMKRVVRWLLGSWLLGGVVLMAWVVLGLWLAGP